MLEFKSKKTSIIVTAVQGSIANGVPIATITAEYPRAIHAQLLTHRVFSKNSSSSRAVPINTAINQILDNPAKPIWTSNQSGMQGPVITNTEDLDNINSAVRHGMNQMIELSLYLGSKKEKGGLNVHKQNVARYLEPFQNIKITLTSTEWENWDWLRDDYEAQGEIEELARLMKLARNEMVYMPLNVGEYHVPYVDRVRGDDGVLRYFDQTNGQELTCEQAILVSQSVAAQTSYRKADGSLEKAEDLNGKLFNGRKVHASPTEHQATPIGFVDTTGVGSFQEVLELMPAGSTHIDRNGELWSANFRNWIQYRQLLPNHDKAKF